MFLFLAMLLLGCVVGFVGAGGAGVTIAMLTIGFNVPIHTALAVALSAMMFTMLSGTISHYREKEVVLATGFTLGAGGIFGAVLGVHVADKMASPLLNTMTASMLLLSALILYTKLYHADFLLKHFPVRQTPLTGRKLLLYGLPIGFINGFLSGAFGIGAAAFIQLCLMIVFGLPLLQSIGTCMLIVLPISCAGGLGFLLAGRLDYVIFAETLAGMMLGAYLGAKFTHRAPRPFLHFVIVAMPTIASLAMFFHG